MANERMTPTEHADLVAFRDKRTLMEQQRCDARLVAVFGVAVACSVAITTIVIAAVLALVR